VFSRAEALEKEPEQMKDLSMKLTALPRSNDPEVQKEAKRIIGKLYAMNQRWNIEPLKQFLLQQQKELLDQASGKSGSRFSRNAATP
jgi:hypothetical protein